ncbi:MAG: hypothetical protein K1060chlam5_01041 [Candidatus Anoxychlamydiales bacterium]|nr:hypothetical protein [Candidatus Anoxychlamydiales bacterium]
MLFEKYKNSKISFLEGYKSIRKIPAFEKILPFLNMCASLGAIGFTIVRNTYKTKHKFIYDENVKFLKNFLD